MNQAKRNAGDGNGGKKPIFKKWWFWVIIVILVAGIAGGGHSNSEDGDRDVAPSSAAAESSGSNGDSVSESSSGAEESASQNPAESEVPAFDAQKMYNEIESALYGFGYMDYAEGELNPGENNVIGMIVPSEKIDTWENAWPELQNRAQSYLNSLTSADDLFIEASEQDRYVQTLILSTLLNYSDKNIRDKVRGAFPEGYDKLAKELAEATEFGYCTTDNLISDLNDNALRAKETYKGRMMVIKGKVSNIDASGSYILIDSLTNSFNLTVIQCYIKNDLAKSAVMNISNGDVVDVVGEVTDVGELMGYSINMYMMN